MSFWPCVNAERRAADSGGRAGKACSQARSLVRWTWANCIAMQSKIHEMHAMVSHALVCVRHMSMSSRAPLVCRNRNVRGYPVSEIAKSMPSTRCSHVMMEHVASICAIGMDGSDNPKEVEFVSKKAKDKANTEWSRRCAVHLNERGCFSSRSCPPPTKVQVTSCERLPGKRQLFLAKSLWPSFRSVDPVREGEARDYAARDLVTHGTTAVDGGLSAR